MADKNNSKIKSTAVILGGLREEELPDELLSPDSPEKKKRDRERFNAMLAVVLIEMMHIKNIIIAHWKREIEKAIQRFEMEMEAYQKKASDLIMVALPNQERSKLSDEQLSQIQSIDKKFIKLLIKINEKITALDQRIQQQNSQLAALQQLKSQKQIELAEIWRNYVDRLDMKNIITLSISLPTQYRDVRGKRERSIEIDGYLQKKILTEIEEDLRKSDYPITDLNVMIQHKLLQYIRLQLNEAWAFLPYRIREQAINERLKEPDIQALLLHPILASISKDSRLNSKIRELHIVEHDIVRITTEKRMNEKLREEFVLLRSHVENEHKKFRADFLTKSENYLPVSYSSNYINEKISAYSKHANLIEESLDRNDQIYTQTMADLETSSLSADNLLADMESFSNEIYQARDSNIKPEDNHLEAELYDLKTKSEALIQSIKDKENEDNLTLTKNIEDTQTPKMDM